MSEMGLECIINTETLISNKMQFETLFVKNMVSIWSLIVGIQEEKAEKYLSINFSVKQV